MERFLAVVVLVASILVSAVPARAQDSSESSSGGMRLAGWLTIIGGAVSLGAGTVMFIESGSRHDNVLQDRAAGRMVDARDVDAVDSYALKGWVLTGIGLAAVGTGVALVLLAPKDKSEPHAQLSVSPGRLVLSGSF